ncbi:hypothetical protein A6770_07875 [Nostoc minutum NIES-26]|uniref:DUF1830 domain-containing protein n=1 Tax=Nostoc minutum NIES-26 TaxID=1844469 RepID=A0A367S1M5_9NOSO|nr:DUF1830 domain-containing protein [Dendronalium sp. ChiSLP03b]MDZ8206435.1 DUF1830 domain-containing protein [Dendronalium sp. ChiSLP03b]RCJ42129.1 hypothetical protein A6770_07875 [Nostoc minutum NIES-26]
MNNQILCFYKNTTNQLQIARISAIFTANECFEQIVFPGEQLFFKARPDAELKIDTDTKTGVIQTNKILCLYLKVLGED